MADTRLQAPDTSRSEPREAGETIHRRETRRQIILPMVGASLLIFIIFLMAALLPLRVQVSTLADWMTTIFLLCPAVICLLPIYIILVAGVYGMNKLHNSVGTPLQKLEHFSEGVANRIESATTGVNRQTVKWRARFAPLEKLMSIFDKSTS